MKNFSQKGTHLSLTTPGAGVVGGTPCRVGSIIGVPAFTRTAAEVTADATIKFVLVREGVFEVPRATGGGTAWTEGVKIYWDDSAKKFTKSVVSDSGDALVGAATAAAADGAATGFLLFDGAVR